MMMMVMMVVVVIPQWCVQGMMCDGIQYAALQCVNQYGHLQYPCHLQQLNLHHPQSQNHPPLTLLQ